MKRKYVLRISTLIIILMFLLMLLLSSPVAAAGTGTYNCYAITDNTPGGPTAQAACPPPYTISGPGPNSATFTCSYSFSDSNPTGTGSNHRATLTVSPPGPPLGGVSTGWVPLGAGGSASGSISVGPLTYRTPASWIVTLEVWCTDISTGQTAYTSVTVTVTG